MNIDINEFKLTATLRYFLSIHEADAVIAMLSGDSRYNGEDIIEYLDWIHSRYEDDLPTDFESWVEDRQPRIQIEIFVTEDGHPIHEKLEFPKRGEEMKNGAEFEWYYSLREVTDQILALKIGESMNFKIRDDKKSHGTILRIA